jgi:hypothetical protein
MYWAENSSIHFPIKMFNCFLSLFVTVQFLMSRIYKLLCILIICGPGSSVGIATGYGLDGPGIEFGGGEIFLTGPDRPWGPPSLLNNGYRVFPRGRKQPGRVADSSPPSSAEF